MGCGTPNKKTEAWDIDFRYLMLFGMLLELISSSFLPFFKNMLMKAMRRTEVNSSQADDS